MKLFFVLLLAGPFFQAPSLAQGTEENSEDVDRFVQEYRPRYLVVPTIFYTPETRFAFGSAGAAFFQFPSNRTSGRVSQVLAAFIVTQNKQILSEITPDLFFGDDGQELFSSLQFVRFPDKFYGIGRDAPHSAEEKFTANKWRFHVEWLIRIRPSLYIGPNIGILHQTLVKTDNGGVLQGMTIPGAAGGLTTRLGIQLVWDRRDNINYTSKGSYLKSAVMVANELIGSDYNFIRYLIDARCFLPLPRSQTFATQFYTVFMPGNVPFLLMPTLGGDNRMRGYYEGRYRDHLFVTLQTEYRVPIWRFIGMAAFLSIGDVASSIRVFNPRTVKVAGGVGLRLMLSREDKLNVRVDYGLGKDTSGIYITVQEAF